MCILARFTPFLLSFRPTLLKNGVLLHWIQDSQHIRCPYLTMIKQIHTNFADIILGGGRWGTLLVDAAGDPVLSREIDEE